MGKSQFEKAVVCFSKAITLQPEQVLHYYNNYYSVIYYIFCLGFWFMFNNLILMIMFRVMLYFSKKKLLVTHMYYPTGGFSVSDSLSVFFYPDNLCCVLDSVVCEPRRSLPAAVWLPVSSSLLQTSLAPGARGLQHPLGLHLQHPGLHNTPLFHLGFISTVTCTFKCVFIHHDSE